MVQPCVATFCWDEIQLQSPSVPSAAGAWKLETQMWEQVGRVVHPWDGDSMAEHTFPEYNAAWMTNLIVVLKKGLF